MSPQDHIIEALLSAGPLAVVSHESALNLHGLSDVVPSAVHLVAPRSHRWVAGRLPRGVALHTTVRPLPSNAMTTVGAVRVTTPARSIVDAADAGTARDQIPVAIREALNEGLTTPRELRAVSGNRSARVRELVDRGIREAKAPEMPAAGQSDQGDGPAAAAASACYPTVRGNRRDATRGTAFPDFHRS